MPKVGDIFVDKIPVLIGGVYVHWTYWRKLVYFGHTSYWKKLNWYILVIEATEVNWYVLVFEDISILWTKLSWTYWRKLVYMHAMNLLKQTGMTFEISRLFSAFFQLWIEYCVTQIYLLKETGIFPLHYWNKLVWFASWIIPVYFSSARKRLTCKANFKFLRQK